MNRLPVLLLVIGLLFAGATHAQQPQAKLSKRDADAFDQFRQSVYEFGLSLVLDADGGVQVDIRQMWQSLTRLRETVCPKPLISHLREVSQSATVDAAARAQLDSIQADLEAIRNTVDISDALEHLEAARTAAAAGNAATLRLECQAIMDSVVGQLLGIKLEDSVAILRRASNLLSISQTPEKRHEAFAVLRELPYFERGKTRAYRDALSRADMAIAAASDLYLEGYYIQAKQQLVFAGPPLKLAKLAAPDIAAQQRINVLVQQLAEANALLTQGWTDSTGAGFRLLRKARSELGELASQPVPTTLGQIAPPAEFPKPYNTEPASSGEPSPAEKAAAAMRVPEGFKVNVFAAEPEVCNPIAMSWDARGRLWIAENYTYAERPKKLEFALRDRIIILADEDGDGRSDRRTVFADDVQDLTGIEWSPTGVWAICPPQLLFIPDRDGDDKPDGPAQVMLDGFTVPPENFHNFANGLHWGPDGWLYGRCGASAPGEVGIPGTPADRRIPVRGGLWRFHPERRVFETLNHGTTNPWGNDWNEHGEAFFVNTVNGHLWYSIVGAHFVRPHTIDPNPRVYECIDMHADHWHWDTGKSWTDSRSATGEHDRLGGGHAHTGTMIYLADQWPEQYRGRLFTINMHGRRLNDERLEREGSGYVARHDPDMIFAADPFFRGLELSYGPDGSAYIIDWSDAGECHESTGVHRTSGRVYRVTYGDPAPQKPIDLGKLGVDELVALHKHSNEWYARQARRQLVARAERGEHSRVAADQLTAMTREADSTAIRLRALGSLFAIGQADDQLLHALLADRDEHLRTWAIRLLTDRWPLDTVMGPEAHVPPASVTTAQLAELVALAKSDDSGLVRLVLASVLQRLAVTQRPALATALASRDEDADDHNLPAMVWYGLIPVGDVDPQRLPQVAAATRWPKLRQWIARRLAEDLAKNAAPLDALLATAASKPDGGLLADALAGMSAGLAGWHKAPRPASWDKVQTAAEAGSASERELVRDLSVLFGDGRALGEVRKIALDGSADMNLRRAALETLIQSRPDDLRSICEALLGTRFLNTIAVRGLAAFDDPKLGAKLAKNYKKFHHSERAAIMETLVSRPTFALAMLDEMAAGNIARSDLSVFQARQIRSFKDPKLAKRLADVWGEIRDSSADKTQAIAQLKEQLTPTVLGESDAGQGRVVFNTACATCHRLYGHGGEIGPDLTGAARQNIDYLLSNIVDPSAVVTADFRMSVVQLADGRVLNGIVRSQNQRTVTLQTAKERLAIDRGDIDAIEPSPLSLMPEGLLQPLKPDQVRNLFAYLMTFSQVPLPPGAPPTDVTGDAGR